MLSRQQQNSNDVGLCNIDVKFILGMCNLGAWLSRCWHRDQIVQSCSVCAFKGVCAAPVQLSVMLSALERGTGQQGATMAQSDSAQQKYARR